LSFWLENQKALTQKEAQAALDSESDSPNKAVPSILLSQSPIPDYVSVEVAV
jgi:hypothetical protein